MKRILTILITLMLSLLPLTAGLTEGTEEPFAQWQPEAPALKALTEYVEAVTDETNADYIPPAERIAVFDMDGTLCAELNPTYLEHYLLAWRILKDPSYTPDEEMLAFGRMLRDHALDKSFPENMDMLHATHAARAYAGMTLTQFADFVTNCLVREADGFEGMTYAGSFYLPMVEVVEYLQDHDFKVYVVSGSDRFICRTFIEGVLDIPYENIIGMDVALEATHQEGKDGLDYVYTSEDTIVRTDRLLIKNLKMNKVSQIVKEIGRQPVLSFGNSSGDVSMHNYTIFNNPHRSAAFMLVADNETQDYGNAEKVQPLREKWEESGYHVISMRDDFRTIYGEDVVKTGSFHWLEDLAEERVPAETAEGEGTGEENSESEEESAAETTAETQESAGAEAAEGGIQETYKAESAKEQEAATAEEELQDYQYVMFLGTNDKDSGKPVFTEEEIRSKTREILLRHFGGYTLQEALGGWIDGEKEYTEYTMVIYLSDTTLEAVHAAADEMLATFNQSSVLIQQNPTKTEFYSGK